MKKLKLRTQKYYNIPPVCHFYWTEKDWEKVAFYRTEPKRIIQGGYVWRAWERNADGVLLYMRAEPVSST